jgi:hypothetical protein
MEDFQHYGWEQKITISISAKERIDPKEASNANQNGSADAHF